MSTHRESPGFRRGEEAKFHGTMCPERLSFGCRHARVDGGAQAIGGGGSACLH